MARVHVCSHDRTLPNHPLHIAAIYPALQHLSLAMACVFDSVLILNGFSVRHHI